MTLAGWVELSQENRTLALAELSGALRALGGARAAGGSSGLPPSLVAVEAPTRSALQHLAARLALARRVLVPVTISTGPDGAARAMRREGAGAETASFRALRGTSSGPLPAELRAAAGEFVAGGGRIDLREPARRFVGFPAGTGKWTIAEQVGEVDRTAFELRRQPHLPFQRPVTLAPRLARVAANLAEVRAGDQVVDPFAGTGALLGEAAALGARVTGVDRDAAMVRGAIQNFAHLGREAEQLRVGDAGDAFPPSEGEEWHALLTDPPYGRSSGTGGEAPGALLSRALRAWAPFLRPGAPVVVVLPTDAEVPELPWVAETDVPDYVHRSLTRRFRVYRATRAGVP